MVFDSDESCEEKQQDEIEAQGRSQVSGPSPEKQPVLGVCVRLREPPASNPGRGC